MDVGVLDQSNALGHAPIQKKNIFLNEKKTSQTNKKKNRNIKVNHKQQERKKYY